MSSAYLLIFHGSRDARSTPSVAQLAQLVREQSQENLTTVKKPLVGIASLEFAPVSLAVTLKEFALEAQSLGLKTVKIMPLFLLPGVHVKEDIPQEVNQAQEIIGNSLKLELLPYLGSHPALIDLLRKKFEQLPSPTRILLSHGSRREGGNHPIEAIASSLQATVAYWSITPSLFEQVSLLVKAGNSTIAIVPYFLFSGGITEQIATQVKQLELDYPLVNFYLGEPLGVTPELANLIIESVRV